MTFNKIVKKLIEKDLCIATMESCTGGGVASEITNIPGSSEILKFSAVTYSNLYKIKMGVNEDVINKYSVYSINVAREMAFNIKEFANAQIGIGVTGKLNRIDPANNYGKNNEVFISIYYNQKYYDYSVVVTKSTRKQNKKIVIDKIIKELEVIIDEEDKQN